MRRLNLLHSAGAFALGFVVGNICAAPDYSEERLPDPEGAVDCQRHYEHLRFQFERADEEMERFTSGVNMLMVAIAVIFAVTVDAIADSRTQLEYQLFGISIVCQSLSIVIALSSLFLLKLTMCTLERSDVTIPWSVLIPDVVRQNVEAWEKYYRRRERRLILSAIAILVFLLSIVMTMSGVVFRYASR